MPAESFAGREDSLAGQTLIILPAEEIVFGGCHEVQPFARFAFMGRTFETTQEKAPKQPLAGNRSVRSFGWERTHVKSVPKKPLHCFPALSKARVPCGCSWCGTGHCRFRSC